MALSTLTLLSQVNSTSTDTSLASGSFTPTANALLVVACAVASGNTDEPLPTSCTDSVGLTWTKHVEKSQVSDIRTAMACIFTAIAPASPSAMTVTVSWQNSAPRNSIWVAEIATGYDSAEPVAQVGSNSGNNVTTLTVTLDATPDAGSTLVGAMASRSSTGSITTDADYTVLGAVETGGTSARAAAYNEGSADVDVAWSNIDAGGSNPTAGVLVEIAEAATGSFSLTAAAGSFTLTGTAASLERGLHLAAAAASFALSGTAAALKRGFALTAGAGSFTLTGTAAALRTARILAAGAAGFTLTGTAATLKRARILTAAAASFTLTGVAATLNKGLTLVAAAASLVLTGTFATLIWSGFKPDAGRTFTVEVEDRTLSVHTDSRTLNVEVEDRTQEVKGN